MSLLNRARELDKRAFGAVAAAELPGLEYILPRLSRIANHSVLWGGVAGGLALTRQPRLRRAALRGGIAIGLASPLANLVGKQAFRRPRPLIELFTSAARPTVTRVGVTLIPSIRSPWRLPTSPSFPSGHSASAAAFATGVSLEAPAAVAVPVGITAAAVAFSRIYTGAHYPGDVLAGVALGTAAGLGTRLLWPTMPRSASARWAMPAEAVPGVSEDGEGLVVVVNPDAGNGDVAQVLKERLPAAEIVESGADLAAMLKDAAGRAAVLGACGGDGTIRAAAGVALEHDLPLLVIPGGTLNHFARALGVHTVADAVAAYRSGCVARVDVGRAAARSSSTPRASAPTPSSSSDASGWRAGSASGRRSPWPPSACFATPNRRTCTSTAAAGACGSRSSATAGTARTASRRPGARASTTGCSTSG
ncbi:hypothetical protein GCM10029978_105970 [Actinoallomurus acanthiterrae]